METEKTTTQTSYETSDISLAAHLYSSGVSLLSINRTNIRRCIFTFQNPDPELISEWQSGTANVNGLAFFNGLQFLKRMIFEGKTKYGDEDD